MWAATRANPLKVLEKNRRFSFVVCHFGMGQQSPRSGKKQTKEITMHFNCLIILGPID